MKTNAIVRIVIFSLLIVVLTGALAYGLSANIFSFVPGSKQDTLETDYAIPMKDIRSIEIQWISGDVNLQTGSGSEIRFTESEVPEEDRLVYTVSGDKLIIAFCQKVDLLHITSIADLRKINIREEKDLTVTVPRSMDLKKLTISAVSAYISGSELTAGDIEVNTVSGSSSFTDCKAEQLETNCVSGQVTYRGELEKLEANTVSGDVEAIFSGAYPGKVEFNSTSGDLTLRLPENCGYRCTLESLGGSVYSDFEGGSSGKHHSHGSEDCTISGNSLSGSISIRKAEN